jgi:hypothetical protein
MFLKLQILQVKDILVTTPDGDLDIEKAHEIMAELISLENIPGEHVILLDARKSHLKMSVTEIWFLTRELAEHRKAFQRRFAVLVTEPELADAQFFETATRNLGFFVHVTTDFENAIKWLAKIDDLDS